MRGEEGLSRVIDPKIDLNIVNLGLIYGTKVKSEALKKPEKLKTLKFGQFEAMS